MFKADLFDDTIAFVSSQKKSDLTKFDIARFVLIEMMQSSDHSKPQNDALNNYLSHRIGNKTII